jgi:hypothetical protein
VPCSRVFRSSAPSEHLPPSPSGRCGAGPGWMRQYSIKGNGGSAPVRRATSTELPNRADLKGMLPGPVRFQGEWNDAIARAQRAAARLEPAWERWRAARDSRSRAARDSRSRAVSLSVGRGAPD